MRLDLFLKASRLCPRRSVAQKLCDAGLVAIAGRAAKSAYTVKPGDEITIRTHSRLLIARVLDVPASSNTSRKDASSLVQLLKDQRLPEFGSKDEG